MKTTAGVKRFPAKVYEGAIAAVEANQHTDGGWTWQKAAGNETALKSASEPDLTGAAMAALCTAGVPATAETIVKAKASSSRSSTNRPGRSNPNSATTPTRSAGRSTG